MLTQQGLSTTDDALSFTTAIELADLIQSGKVSSEQVTLHYLSRLERFGPAINAIATLTPEVAIREARQADRDLAAGNKRSRLHGVPYGVKDLFAFHGAPTTWGSKLYKHRVIETDAAVVQLLRKAGCPLLGKLATIEFAGSVGYRYASASLTGAASTPWNIGHWSGGSSSGSGASVAAGLVGFAIGTETWGSILCPASFCGVSGLRPSSGRVSRDGVMTLSPTMDKVGPLCRSAHDCAAVLEIISGVYGVDHGLRSSSEAKFRAGESSEAISELRLGVVTPDYGPATTVQEDTDAVFERALDVLRSLGVHLSETTLPDLSTDEAAGAIITSEAIASFEEIVKDENLRSQVIDPEMRDNFAANIGRPALDYIKALNVRQKVLDAVSGIYSNVDLLVAPAFLQTAPPITANLDEFFAGSDQQLSSLANLAGMPAMSTPMGFGSNGLPLGIQFIGPPLREDLVITMAAAFEEATPWSRLHPPHLTNATVH